MLERIDHLVFATADLDSGIACVEELFGVSVVAGGHHPDFGTHNALVSLGQRTYLEIVAPDPKRTEPSLPELFRLHQIDQPQLVTWAVRGNGLDNVAANAVGAGFDLGSVASGSRLTQEGTLLEWLLTDPYADRLGGIIPFFIDWLDTPHPASSLPRACVLQRLTFLHPDVSLAEAAFTSIGITANVSYGPVPSMLATIETPTGVVTLT